MAIQIYFIEEGNDYYEPHATMWSKGKYPLMKETRISCNGRFANHHMRLKFSKLNKNILNGRFKGITAATPNLIATFRIN